jgi:class 3 adenylate cyclase
MVEMVKSALHADRKLVAILAADIVGYSCHMEQDEVATLEALSRHRSTTDRLILERGGRITGTAGDSFIAEFPSVLSAVECAVEIQEAVAEANAKLDDQARVLEFRIGVNVSDVMIKGRDIFGDGVNVTARLESLSEAGAVCVSRGVRDYVAKQTPYVFDDVGEQWVKNLAEPIRAYGIRFAGGRALRNAVCDSTAAMLPNPVESPPENTSSLLIAAGLLAVLVTALTVSGYLRAVDVLVVGGLAWLVLNLSAFCDNSLPAQTKAVVSGWLRPASGIRLRGSDVFLVLFESVFTKDHLGRKCILRSMLLSVVAFVVLFAAFMDTAALEWRMGQLEQHPHPLEPWMRIALGAMALCLCNVFADYISLYETRLVLKLAKRYGMLPLFAVLDIVLTACVFLLVVAVTLPLISLATGNIHGFLENVGRLWSNTPNVVSQCVSQNLVRWLKGEPIDYVAMYVLPSVITTFLTTIWLVAALISAPALRATTWSRTTGLTMLGRFADAARRPFTALGYAAAILIIGLSLIVWPFRAIVSAPGSSPAQASASVDAGWKKPKPNYCRTDPTVIPSLSLEH